MSLRLRLTILYSTLTGGILLVFGMLIFFLVNLLLVKQVDDILLETASDILSRVRVSPLGELVLVDLPNLDVTANVYVQIMNTSHLRGGGRMCSPRRSHLSRGASPMPR